MVKKNIKYLSGLFSGCLVIKCMYLNNEKLDSHLLVELD